MFTSFKNAQNYATLREDQTLYILAKVVRGVSIEYVRRALAARLSDVDVVTNGEFSQMTRFYWMFTTGAGVAVLLAALLGLIVGVVVVAQTIYATTMDHIREYGTLKAIGATNRYLHGVIIQQAIISAVIGYALGMAASWFIVRGSEKGGAAILGHVLDAIGRVRALAPKRDLRVVCAADQRRKMWRRREVFPPSLHAFRVVHVQLAVHDLPRLGIAISGVPMSDSPGALAAKLRRVFLQRLNERITVRCGAKLPARAVPCGFEWWKPANGVAVREVGDRVVAAECQIVGWRVDGGFGAGGRKRQKEREDECHARSMPGRRRQFLAIDGDGRRGSPSRAHRAPARARSRHHPQTPDFRA